jgi:hypothetical protein
MSEPLLQVRNRHSASCGDPPVINSDDPDVYTGYFENSDGEQWVFTYHRASREAFLRGGDIGWNNPLVVAEGKVLGLIMRPEESAWLAACWRSAVGGS